MGAGVPKAFIDTAPTTTTAWGVLPTHPSQHLAPRTTILERTIATFMSDPSCQAVVVCAPSDWLEAAQKSLQAWKRVTVVPGGDTRQRSVFNGVKYLSDTLGTADNTVVLVHDAARCCISRDLISRIVEGTDRLGAVTAAVPVVDAMVRVIDGMTQEVVSREGVWNVQTPQGFHMGDLLRAHERAEDDGVSAMDDAALVRTVRPVHVVLGDRKNIKITTPEDLELVTKWI